MHTDSGRRYVTPLCRRCNKQQNNIKIYGDSMTLLPCRCGNI